MEPVKVVFNSMEECQKYIRVVENVPFNIDLQCGSRVIDGKSALGILGFGLRKVLELRVHTEDSKAWSELLEKIEFCICGEEMKMAI
ncbi:MAG: hypothetical protein GX235_02605 [Clostridiales bacterium]|nr:hypothetical protein [Clostridiales bacterium]